MKPKERLAVVRALDANANRVREGLRVAEDVARFIWNDSGLTSLLKKIRHGVTEAEKGLLSARLRVKARDVEGDKGKGNQQTSERARNNAWELFAANLKRAEEALRSLEEFSKLAGRAESKTFKRLRFECYKAEEKAAKR